MKGGFLFSRKNKKNNKNKNSFTQVNPLKARQNERKKQQENKKKANNLLKGLEQLGFAGGRRTRKQPRKFMRRK